MGAEEAPFRTLSLVDDEPVLVDEGNLQWVPVRRRLGISAFGTNGFRAAGAGDPIIEEHVESPGQEELYVIVAGRVRFTVDGHDVEVSAGGALFVPRPESRRGAVALEAESVVLAIGGWPGKAYHSLPWEPIYLSQEPMRQGDFAGAAEILEREGGEHLANAFLQFRLACCHARLGEHELALEELHRAIELNPKMRERAEREEHLAGLRGLDGWPAPAG